MSRKITTVIVCVLLGLGATVVIFSAPAGGDDKKEAPAPGGAAGELAELKSEFAKMKKQVEGLEQTNKALQVELKDLRQTAQLSKDAIKVSYFDITIEKAGSNRKGMVQISTNDEFTTYWNPGEFAGKVVVAFPVVQGHTRAVDSIRDLEGVWDGKKAGIKARYWGHKENLHASVRVFVLFQ